MEPGTVPIRKAGDPVYPLLPSLIKKFPAGGNDAPEQFFGWRLCSARDVIQCVYVMLKSRFGALKRDMDINLHDLPTVIHTCFIHNHNYCEMNKEYVANDLVKKVMEYERIPA